MSEIVIVTICLIFNAFFSAFEMAFVSAPKPELRRLSKNGSLSAKKVLDLRKNPERTLSIIQIGITLVGALSAVVGGAGAAEVIEPYFIRKFSLNPATAEAASIIIVVIPLTYLNVVIGELVPKTLAMRNAVGISLVGAKWLAWADLVLGPIVSLLEWSTKILVKVFFSKQKNATPPPQTTLEIDSLAQHHQQAILNLAYIERKKAKDIVLPWKNVLHIKTSDSLETMVSMIFASGHTRLPVADENGVVTGLLHTKEALASRETGNKEWRSLIKPIIVVQPEEPILNVLRSMQKSRNHMAVIANERTPLGIVTFEDISEEIWGDLYDEDEDSQIKKIFASKIKGKMPGV